MKKPVPMIIMAIIAAAFCAVSATAQTITPRVRIVVPERFRALTNQYFDLRVEAEAIVNSERTKFQIIVENDNGTEPREGWACPAMREAVNYRDFAPPKLFQAYLRFGVKVCSPSVLDQEFGTIDHLVLFDAENISPHARQTLYA